MKAYLAKKLIAFPIILIGVSMLIFVSIRALPGDPGRLMAGPEATQEAVDAMRVRVGLDQPLLTQYVHFAGGIQIILVIQQYLRCLLVNLFLRIDINRVAGIFIQRRCGLV